MGIIFSFFNRDFYRFYDDDSGSSDDGDELINEEINKNFYTPNVLNQPETFGYQSLYDVNFNTYSGYTQRYSQNSITWDDIRSEEEDDDTIRVKILN